jgi:hypothetical protein
MLPFRLSMLGLRNLRRVGVSRWPEPLRYHLAAACAWLARARWPPAERGEAFELRRLERLMRAWRARREARREARP